MRALRVELTRLRWRRAVLLLLVAAVVLPALLLAGTAWGTRPMDEATVDSLLSDRFAQREVTRCERRPEQYAETGIELAGEPGATSLDPGFCRDLVAGWYGGRSPLLLTQERQDSLLAVGTILLLLLLLVGTTFVGHDWNTGSMSNQLLFEPRRARVWLTKAAAVVLVAGVLATAVLAAYWSGLVALSDSRGLVQPPGAVGDGYAQVLRTGALAAGAALGGYALTMLFRSTVATVGILFGVAVASGALLGVIGPGAERWQPALNLGAVVLGEITYYDDSDLPPECFSGAAVPDGGCDAESTISASDGGLYLGSGLLVAVAGSVLSFRRRDVS